MSNFKLRWFPLYWYWRLGRIMGDGPVQALRYAVSQRIHFRDADAEHFAIRKQQKREPE